MNPCEVCGERVLHYPGTCDTCAQHRRAVAETQWMPSYAPTETPAQQSDLEGHERVKLLRRNKGKSVRLDTTGNRMSVSQRAPW